MAKTVNALGQIAAIKKENARKEKAYNENKQYEELLAEQNEKTVAEPVVQQTATTTTPTPSPTIVSSQPIIQEQPVVHDQAVVHEQPAKTKKKQMSDLFEKHVGNTEAICVKVDKSVLKEIDKICKANNIKRSTFVNKALEVLLNSYEY